MEQRTLTLRFLCPAFLGDARQNGAWRTPPFKAQIRQWWRLAMAAQGADWPRIREAEGELFGDASNSLARKSLLRLRLNRWDSGQLTDWSRAVDTDQLSMGTGNKAAAADTYLAYGPIQSPAQKLKGERAVAANESAGLRLAWPGDVPHADCIPIALSLMHRLGTIGGRSRNGWGSFAVDGTDPIDLNTWAIDWRSAIERDSAPRGVGRDDQGLLLWQSKPHQTWEAVMSALGRIRKDLNTESDQRTLLSYPVTNKTEPGLSNQDRVPNSLRFKMVKDGDEFRGLVFHLPCRPSDELWRKLNSSAKHRFAHVWEKAHEYLDDRANGLQRVST